MTALGLINAGSRITASMLRAVAPLAAYKTADETVTSSTTLQADDQLFIALLANATYSWDLWLNYEGGTQGSSDLKTGWSLPASASLKGSAEYVNNAGSSIVEVYFTGASTLAPGTNGSGQVRGFTARGTITTSATAGNMQLEWCQNTVSATGTIVHAGSVLRAWQIA